MAFTVSRNLLTKVPVGRVLYLGLLLGVSLGGASAVAPSLVQKCSSSENPNNSSVPMVTPPSEIVGLWSGSNCGVDDPSPMTANLTMENDGTNVWYFDGQPQTGIGVEAVIGWQCVDVGKGYWWGMVPNSNVAWCNVFQVTNITVGDNTPALEYINWSYGGEGVGAISTGECPVTFSTEKDLKPLQASFTRTVSAAAVAFTCSVPAGSSTKQPSCKSQFEDGSVPNPFQSGESLPVIDAETCKPTSAAAAMRVTVIWGATLIFLFSSLGQMVMEVL